MSPMNTPKQNITAEKQVLKKHVSAIHIGAKLTFLQRKLVNALLYNAYDVLLTEKNHTINTRILCEMIGFDSKNIAYLKDALKGLMETVVEFDVMEDDGQRSWEAMVLLPYAKIKGNTCTYRYERALAEKLYHPDVYSKINLSVLREMKSSHALVLYENCHRYLGAGQTAIWELDVFRKLMAIENRYKEFKFLKRDVIQPAIKEVNSVSNIKIDLRTIRKGRSVVAIQFSVTSSPQTLLFGVENDEISSFPAYEALLNEGISKNLARAWIVEHGNDYVLKKLEYVNSHASNGKIKTSKAGFLKSAIEKDFQDEREIVKSRKKSADTIREARYTQEQELNKLMKDVRDIERAYREYCAAEVQNVFDVMSEDTRASLRQEFSNSLKDQIFKTEFERRGWSSRTNFLQICEFWNARKVALPSQEAFAENAGMQSPKKIREKIQTLESILAKPYKIAI